MAKARFTFPKAKQDEYLQRLREGTRRGAAADIVFGGQDAARRRNVRMYIADHPEFEKLVLDAEVEATEHVEEALYQAAVSGSVAAAKTWLDRHEGTPVPSSGSKGRDPVADPNDPFADLDNVLPMRRR